MERYTEYYKVKLQTIDTNIMLGGDLRKIITRNGIQALKAMACLYLLSEDYLSVFNQYTERCLSDVKTFQIGGQFSAIMETIKCESDDEPSWAKTVSQQLHAIKGIVEDCISTNIDKIAQEEAHIFSIDEELMLRTLLRNTEFFSALAKRLLSKAGYVDKDTSVAVYMSARYAILFAASATGSYGKQTDTLYTKSAVAIQERFKVGGVTDNMPSLIEIQGVLQQKAPVSEATFKKWLTEIRATTNAFIPIGSDYALTSEFGG